MRPTGPVQVGPPVCDHPVIVEPPSLSDVKARLAALRDRGAARGQGAPGGATPGHIDAMHESMEILSDPEMAMRLRAGRQAVAAADSVGLEELPGASPPASDQWRVVLTGPVARQLAGLGEPAAVAVRGMLAGLATSPAEQGRALGMGLVGVWSARGASHRILYAIQDGERLVTVLSIDDR